MTNMDKDQSESLLKFPCDFTLKIFGLGNDEFESEVLMIVNKHIHNVSDRAIQSRPSENGKYRALTITIYVENRQQLDDLYKDLSSSPHVLMAL